MFSIAPKGAMPFVTNVSSTSSTSSTSSPCVPLPSPQHAHNMAVKGGVFQTPHHPMNSTAQHSHPLPKLITTPSPIYSTSPTSSSNQENNVVTLQTDDLLQRDHSWKTLLKAIFRWKTQGSQKPSSNKIEVSGNRVLIPSSLLKTPSETPLDTSPSSPLIQSSSGTSPFATSFSHHPHTPTLHHPVSPVVPHPPQSLQLQSVRSSILRNKRGSASVRRGNRTSSSFHLFRNSQARLESIAEDSEVSPLGKASCSSTEGRPNSELLKRRGLHLWDDASPLDISMTVCETHGHPFGCGNSADHR